MVFLVDDDALVLKIVSKQLRGHGFNVAVFPTCEEFLATYTPALSGCLVLDIAMPGRNGLELQQILTERGSHLPIIFLTSSADVPMCVQAMQRGAVDFFTKPVSYTQLCVAIRRALELALTTRQQRANNAPNAPQSAPVSQPSHRANAK